MVEQNQIQEYKLIEASLAGDVSSFETLVQTYQSHIYNIARRYFDQEDAEDMTQEILIKLYLGLSSFRQESSFKTFVYSVAINRCHDELRRRQLRKSVLSAVTIDEGLEVSDKSFNPEHVFEANERRERIEEAIKQLPEQNRQAIILREIMGYSYDEISEMENCPVGTVKSRIKRGREHLKQYLDEGGEKR